MSRRSRKPALPQPISLDGFSRYDPLSECLSWIASALERSGWGKYDLPKNQQRLLSDLHEGLDEEALASMLEFWEWDWDRLFQRKRSGWGRGRAPAKPQIDVWLEVTSKGNFKAEWFPKDGSQHHNPPDSDFPAFSRQEDRHIAFGSRPSNELFFLHGVEDAIHCISGDDLLSAQPTAALNTALLHACDCVVDQLKKRLKPHFNVRMRADLFLDWEESERSRDFWETPTYKLIGWKIDDPLARERLAELAELDELEVRYGFGEADIQKAEKALSERARKSGPAPAPHTFHDRLTRELKKSRPKATLGNVRRALELIERHRGKAAKVVQLRPDRRRDR